MCMLVTRGSMTWAKSLTVRAGFSSSHLLMRFWSSSCMIANSSPACSFADARAFASAESDMAAVRDRRFDSQLIQINFFHQQR